MTTPHPIDSDDCKECMDRIFDALGRLDKKLDKHVEKIDQHMKRNDEKIIDIQLEVERQKIKNGFVSALFSALAAALVGVVMWLKSK